MNKKFLYYLAFALFFALVTIAAYNNLIPHSIKAIPHYDSIGHFVLFGIYGFLAHLAFRRRTTSVFGRIVYIGPTLVLVYAFLDESFQALSPNRTFDLADLFFGVMGVLFFVFLDW